MMESLQAHSVEIVGIAVAVVAISAGAAYLYLTKKLKGSAAHEFRFDRSSPQPWVFQKKTRFFPIYVFVGVFYSFNDRIVIFKPWYFERWW